MTDLDVDERLRADAVWRGDAAPPSLHEALDAVFADERTAHRRHAPLLAAAAAAVVVAGAATGLAVWRGGADRHVATGPQPQATAPLIYPSGIPRTRGSERLFEVAGLPVDGVLFDPAHPRTLGILVPHSTNNEGCTVHGLEVGVVERVGEVKVQLTGWQYLDNDARSGHATSGCSSDTAIEVKITLHEPLGKRSVVNDGQPAVPIVRVDARTYPVPQYLPPGYEPTPPLPPGASVHVPIRTFVNGADQLVIRAAAKPGDLDQGTVQGHTKVGRETATITGTATEGCVTWPAPAGLQRQVCATRSRLTVDDLVRVAEGLR